MTLGDNRGLSGRPRALGATGCAEGVLRKEVSAFISFLLFSALVVASCQAHPIGGGSTQDGTATPGTQVSSTPEATGPIEWLDDWELATSQAQSENKPILAYFYKSGCRACKHMRIYTWASEPVRALLREEYVTVKINQEANPLLAKQYGVKGAPITLFLTPDGVEIGRIGGFMDPGPFREEALGVLDQLEQMVQ
jgi:thiol:disulfide interchange protein